MFIGKYDLHAQGRNKILSYGQHKSRSPENTNAQNLQTPPENKIELSPENRKKADELTKLTLKLFKIEANDQELKQDKNKISAGLDYLI